MTFRVLETATKLQQDENVAFFVDDQPVTARRGQTVAAVLRSCGPAPVRRSPVEGSERAPYCMMGTCFECLVEIDGLSNCQACLTPVRPGMRIRRQL